jgi:hypothetical protein
MDKYIQIDDTLIIPILESGGVAGAVLINGSRATMMLSIIRPNDIEKDFGSREKFFCEIRGAYSPAKPNVGKDMIICRVSGGNSQDEVYIVADQILIYQEDNPAYLDHRLFEGGYKQAIIGLENDVSTTQIKAIVRGREIVKMFTDFQAKTGRPSGPTSEKDKAYRDLILEYQQQITTNPEIGREEFCHLHNVSLSTLNRALRYVSGNSDSDLLTHDSDVN